MFKFSYYLLVLFLFFSSIKPVHSLTIAVLELSPKGTHDIIVYAISDIIRSEFVNVGNFTVVERSQIKAIFDEYGLQMAGCTDEDCAIKIGKILSAKKVVVGEVNTLGETTVITIRYIDVRTGISMFSSMGEAPNIDNVIATATSTAKDLIRKIIQNDKEIITPISSSVYYSVGFIPGCGQLYASEEIKGWIFLGSFIATGAFTLYSIYNFNKKRDEYRDLPELTVGSDKYDRKYNDAKRAGHMAIGAITLVSMVYLANWIDILFYTRPVFNKGNNEHSDVGKYYTNINLYQDNIDLSTKHVRFDLKVSYRF